MAAWSPGDTWPSSTPGGVASPYWGGYVRLWVRAALEAGNTFHLGTHTYDRLDAGNVLGGGVPVARAPRAGEERLWVDLTCDVLELEVAGGASSAQGIFSKPDAATASITLADPAGKYDPLSRHSPYAYGGRSRLVPGTPVEVFAEVAIPGTDGTPGIPPESYLMIPNAGARASAPKPATPPSGDLDARAWLTLGTYNVALHGRAISQWPASGTTDRGYALTVRANGRLQFDWFDPVAGVAYSKFSTQNPPGLAAGVKAHLRALLDVDNGAGGNTVTFYYSLEDAPVPSSWVQVGAPVVTAGVTSVATSPRALDIGDNSTQTGLNGSRIYSASVRRGDGTIIANPDFTRTEPGLASVTDSRGNIFTMTNGATIAGTPGTPGTPGIPTTVDRYWLFTGTADSWGEDWVPRPTKRIARLLASDETKRWVKYDQPEQPPAGTGDTTAARVQRLINYFGWLGELEAASSSTVTLGPTTLAQTGWELLNRTLDDELGYVYFTTEGALRWVNRATWLTLGEPVIVLGCDALEDEDDTFHDVILDAAPSNLDRQMRNAIYAARTGGTTAELRSQSSIERHGQYDYNRTDLGLETDTQVGEWAATVLQMYAYPQVALQGVTLRPAIDPRSWEVYGPMLALEYVTDLVRIVWAPPDRPDDVIDGLLRVVGQSHRISRSSWETEWHLVAARPLAYAGAIFTMGAHAQDRLDAGFVLGLT